MADGRVFVLPKDPLGCLETEGQTAAGESAALCLLALAECVVWRGLVQQAARDGTEVEQKGCDVPCQPPGNVL